MNLTSIPSDYYLRASTLFKIGAGSYADMKRASLSGGVLERWVSPKTKRVFYKSKNLRLA